MKTSIHKTKTLVSISPPCQSWPSPSLPPQSTHYCEYGGQPSGTLYGCSVNHTALIYQHFKNRNGIRLYALRSSICSLTSATPVGRELFVLLVTVP